MILSGCSSSTWWFWHILHVIFFEALVQNRQKRLARLFINHECFCSLKSSLPCLAASQHRSHSPLIVWRMVDFVVATRVRGDAGSSCGSGFVCAFGLWSAAFLVARSAASLLGIPTCAGIHRSWTSHSWSRSSSSARIAFTRTYCPDGHLGFAIAWMADWLSVKTVQWPGVFVCAWMSRAIRNASSVLVCRGRIKAIST